MYNVFAYAGASCFIVVYVNVLVKSTWRRQFQTWTSEERAFNHERIHRWIVILSIAPVRLGYINAFFTEHHLKHVYVVVENYQIHLFVHFYFIDILWKKGQVATQRFDNAWGLLITSLAFDNMLSFCVEMCGLEYVQYMVPLDIIFE